jgi:glycosyltransferase involved in cell wall biosynthesis
MAEILIATTVYNAEQTIARTIESVLSQTLGDFIYYIMDNASTDGTRSIIRDYMKQDKRIVLSKQVKNDRLVGVTQLPIALQEYPSIRWITEIDADDEYKRDYLEKMFSFAQENNLEVVSCGYEKISSANGEVIKRRELGENLVLYGEKFANEFIKYRGFTVFGWGKLVSRDIWVTVAEKFKDIPFYLYFDTAWSLNCFSLAKRAGVWGESLFRYWQYPKSVSKQFHPNRIENDWFAFENNRQYLEKCDGLNGLNLDFLYAIQLSLLEETLDVIYQANMPLSEKLAHMIRAFEHKTAQDTLTRKADPMFRNLEQREQFVKRIKNWIYNQNGCSKHTELINKLCDLFSVVDSVMGE